MALPSVQVMPRRMRSLHLIILRQITESPDLAEASKKTFPLRYFALIIVAHSLSWSHNNFQANLHWYALLTAAVFLRPRPPRCFGLQIVSQATIGNAVHVGNAVLIRCKYGSLPELQNSHSTYFSLCHSTYTSILETICFQFHKERGSFDQKGTEAAKVVHKKGKFIT